LQLTNQTPQHSMLTTFFLDASIFHLFLAQCLDESNLLATTAKWYGMHPAASSSLSPRCAPIYLCQTWSVTIPTPRKRGYT